MRMFVCLSDSVSVCDCVSRRDWEWVCVCRSVSVAVSLCMWVCSAVWVCPFENWDNCLVYGVVYWVCFCIYASIRVYGLEWIRQSNPSQYLHCCKNYWKIRLKSILFIFYFSSMKIGTLSRIIRWMCVSYKIRCWYASYCSQIWAIIEFPNIYLKGACLSKISVVSLFHL